MTASLSYVPFLDSTGATQKFATVDETVASDISKAYRSVLSGAFIATYLIPISTAISGGAANSHLLQIMAGASLDVLLLDIELDQFASAGAATRAQWEFRRLTTAGTGGTAITPNPHTSADAASGAAAMTLPSLKGTEGVIVGGAGVGTLLAAVPTASAQTPFLERHWDWTTGKAPRIPAGTSNGLALKLITAVATSTLVGYARIAEVSYN